SIRPRSGPPSLVLPLAVGQAFQPDSSALSRQAGKPDLHKRQAGKPDLLAEGLASGPVLAQPGGGIGPILGTKTQPGNNGVVLDVINDSEHLCLIARPVIVGLVLPEYPPLLTVPGVDLMGGVPLDALCDLLQFPPRLK